MTDPQSIEEPHDAHVRTATAVTVDGILDFLQHGEK